LKRKILTKDEHKDYVGGNPTLGSSYTSSSPRKDELQKRYNERMRPCRPSTRG